MHLPTYLVLMATAGIYGLVGLIANFFANKVLFLASIFVLLITAWGTVVQAASAEDWDVKWMLWYLVPGALILLGSLLAMQEGQNQLLSFAGQKTIPSLIPGLSSDYAGAAKQHFLSMVFPLVAKGIATLVGHFVDEN